MRLEYEIELSTFVGTGTAAGIPPPKQTRNVSSNSVTIPGDATIVVGGIKVDARNNDRRQDPPAGRHPPHRHLFRDTNKNNLTTRLYVFITPRIMRDLELRRFHAPDQGPGQAEAQIDPDIPELMPIMIEIESSCPAPVSPPPPTRYEAQPVSPPARKPEGSMP